MPHFLIVALCGGVTSFSASVVFAAAPQALLSEPGVIKPMPDTNSRRLESILSKPDGSIDLAMAKAAIDHMIDSSVDEASTVREVDVWADRVRARIPAGASNWSKLLVLASTLYQPGPWNGGRNFSYNFDDPFAKDVHTAELSTLLATRRGNCVSMPIFFAALARRIGLDVALASAPNHILVKFKLDNGQWVNIEATSGGTLTDAEYQKMFVIAPEAIASGAYLRPLSNRESVVAMAAPLFDNYLRNQSPEQVLALVEIALTYDSKSLVVLAMEAGAYDKQATIKYRRKYPTFDLLSPSQQADFNALMGRYFAIANEVKSLGWRARTAEQDAEYVKSIQAAKASEKGG